ncbi:MAG TPA: substrate-binding domain-containing protein [Vicinamibacterales bacterium]|nr:substrate-binding domain-containing protein [Vicinamibacterales bacterium]
MSLARSVTVAIACALLAAGCGQAGPSRKVVGVTLLTATDAFYKTLEASIREEAAAKDLDLVVVSCEMDPTKQASQIEDFIARHVSAILAAPCDSSAIVPALAGAERAGIPVFTADISAAGGRIVSHVASDNVQGGRLAAQALAGFMGGKGEVLIIDQPTVASVQDRVRGFEEGLRAFPEITIVAKLSGEGQRSKAVQIMEDALQAHPRLSGVFAINDNCALGAVGVIETAGRKDIAVVGYDASDEAQAAIRSGGPLKADVIQHPEQIGKAAIDVIAQHLAGQPVPALKAVDVGIWDGKSR